MSMVFVRGNYIELIYLARSGRPSILSVHVPSIFWVLMMSSNLSRKNLNSLTFQTLHVSQRSHIRKLFIFPGKKTDQQKNRKVPAGQCCVLFCLQAYLLSHCHFLTTCCQACEITSILSSSPPLPASLLTETGGECIIFSSSGIGAPNIEGLCSY